MEENSSSSSRIIRPKDAAILLGISKATLYRWERQGRIAERVKLGPKVSGWRESDLIEFIEKANEERLK
jgi:predicted DNA-binding transcriptional regulator AlpA